jgi:hypothetical protein
MAHTGLRRSISPSTNTEDMTSTTSGGSAALVSVGGLPHHAGAEASTSAQA